MVMVNLMHLNGSGPAINKHCRSIGQPLSIPGSVITENRLVAIGSGSDVVASDPRGESEGG